MWEVPKIWEDETVFILGGGPSLNNVDFDLIKERRIIATNNAYGDPVERVVDKKKIICMYTPRQWVDIVYFGDTRWYDWHRESLQDFAGMKVHCSTRRDKGLKRLHRGKANGIETRNRYVSWNKSTGGSAINLAYHLGTKLIVLLGFDMRRVDNQPNWHVDHPSKDKNPYDRFLKPFPSIANDAKNLGVDIVNCTPGSAIKEFPITILEEFLKNE